MQIVIIIVVALHALSAVFWMATTANLARGGGQGVEILFPRQMGAATIAVLTGGFLWSQLHTGGFGTYEKVLAGGALCALAALIVQIVLVGTRLRRLKTEDAAKARGGMAVAHRIASGLQMVTLVCMVVARYI